MGAGTLYGALSALNAKKLIKECECEDPARREYVITDEGKKVLKKEIERLEELLNNAKTYYTIYDCSLDMLNGFCEDEMKEIVNLYKSTDEYNDNIEDE